MGKILSRSGESLADVYDVEGSIAGVDQLLSHDVNLVHEMGGVLMSERLGGTIAAIQTAAILQNVNFGIGLTLGATPVRLLNVALYASVVARTARAAIHITDQAPAGITDVPISVWDTGGVESLVDVLINGTNSTQLLLEPIMPPPGAKPTGWDGPA